MPVRQHRVLFVTSCPLAWGGSEELWAGAAVALRQRGWVTMTGRLAPWPQGRLHPRWRLLQTAGVGVGNFRVASLSRAGVDAVHRFLPLLSRFVRRLHNHALAARLRSLAPDLVVVSQGQAFDGCYPISMPEICRLAGVRYVLICQKAAEIHWPDDGSRCSLLRGYRGAVRVYFVSEHNRRLVSRQLGIELSNAELVQNPCLVPYQSCLDWPVSPDGVMRLACVARLWPLEKGQDVLLHVLAQAKWRSRALEVAFYGEGPMARGLLAMARYLHLENVHFPGVAHPLEIWRHHHALVLPSRAEGLPLAQVEAMLCGRPVIVSDAGGTAEILQDGVHGFVASAATEVALDEALERAWQRRHDWPSIGSAAAIHVRQLYHPDPCAVFADRLEAIHEGDSRTAPF